MISAVDFSFLLLVDGCIIVNSSYIFSVLDYKAFIPASKPIMLDVHMKPL